MLNSKERSNLLSLANKVDTTVYIGKFGITDSVLAQIDAMLFDHELIKIGVQKNADLTAKECINELAEKLNAEPVHAIGSKIVLYRRSQKEGIEHVDYTKTAKEQSEIAKSIGSKSTKAKAVSSSAKRPTTKGSFDTAKSYRADRKTNGRNVKNSHSPEKKNGVTMYKNGKRYGKK